MKPKWYQSNLAIIAFLFFFSPVGLFLMWKYTRWNKGVKGIITGLSLLFLIGVFTSRDSTTKTSTNNQVQDAQISQEANPVATANPAVIPTIEVSKRDQATVTKVVDGDTIAVNINGIVHTIRIIGINAPETVDPRKSVECFGQKASAIAKEKLTGKSVELEADSSQNEKDKYGRLLRYVWLDNGSNDFGAFMIQNGYAYEYTYNTPYKYQAKYKQFQQEAEANKKGLWADDACPVDPTSIAKPQTNTNSVQNQNTTSGTNTHTYSDGDKDCKDFSSQAEAQAYFNSKGGSASNNVDKLDGNDRDGIVCETLP